MRMKEKLKNAIITAINESFDINDMGNDIGSVTAPMDKQHIRKTSKIYDALKRLVDAKVPMRTGGDFYRLPYDMQVLLPDLLETADDDVRDLVKKDNLGDFVARSATWFRFAGIIKKLANAEAISHEDSSWFTAQTNEVKSKNHDLYALYPVEDKFELRELIYACMTRMDSQINLNWIDVSGMTDMRQMFSVHTYTTPDSPDAFRTEYVTCYEGRGLGKAAKQKVSQHNAFLMKLGHPLVAIEVFNGDISLWDVSNVMDMSGMFANSAFNGDISQWNVSNVRSMVGMFAGSWFDGDISGWDVSHVRTMAMMFADKNFKGDISRWNTSRVCDMTAMFAASRFNGDISSWNVSGVKDMIQMFSESSFNGDISGWDVSGVTSMYGMFEKSEFTGDISRWNISDECYVKHMFTDSSFLSSPEAYRKLPVNIRDKDEIGDDYAENEYSDYEEDER